jgi:hypothetical protein
LARWRILHIPGARDCRIPDEIMAVVEDLQSLRSLAGLPREDAEAQQDVLESDLGQHIWRCRSLLNRDILIGSHRVDPVPARPDLDPAGFGGKDIPASRRNAVASDSPEVWLAMVVVPPQVRSCVLVTDSSGSL